ncbi:MAG: pyruvate, phosphate dikinase [SAR202 cluster bacterium Io17-Chloro-G3]|nr:MAG: pyruvate, phosphate dikinase [SAR202 cluster bacterium Io17-Chloro-G3]
MTQTSKKWVYLLREGTADMRDLLGGKGAGLAEMTAAQLPVPPGFTITTEACNSYYDSGERFPDGMWEQARKALNVLEKETGKRFGDPINPLLVSVRSGAKVSMPGMMDTVLNLGLNKASVVGIAKSSNNERFAYDAYRRFIQMFGKIVQDVPADAFERHLSNFKAQVGALDDTDLTTEHLKEIVGQFLALVEEIAGEPFPQDPQEQLSLAIKAVFASWNGKRAIDYRNFQGIPHDLGTAVNVVAMVFGNMGADSGTGVAFTRDPATGEKLLYGEYLPDAQGEDVVAGIRTPQKLAELERIMPKQYQQLLQIAKRLEGHYRDAQDLEFTIEQGSLYMLQTRSAKRTAQAAVRIAVEMVQEGLISREEALQRVEPNQINHLLLPRFDDAAKLQAEKAGNLLARGLNASPGAASGKAIFDADKAEELGSQGESVILVRPETNPDDVHGMLHAKGILTARGGATSHAAVVARGLGKPCVAGVAALIVDPEVGRCSVDGRIIREGEEVSIDGTTGEIFIGKVRTIDPHLSEERDLITLLEWADEVKSLGVWANADDPIAAQRALEFGAEGIGLCRTEHMFFEDERLPWMRQMILAASKATRQERELEQLKEFAALDASSKTETRLIEEQTRVAESQDVRRYHEALDALLGFQVQDFKEILRVMTGKPVIIRLLDPPLHEFLPRYEELLEDVIGLRLPGKDAALRTEQEALFEMVNELREQNPMLGLRGCRLGIMHGAINQMQARAIFTAACSLVKEGLDPRPEIMVPLVGHANELSLVRRELQEVGEMVQKEQGVNVSYKIGTMIELPRAALTADDIAQHAQFFSFGTNDLTQTTFGISRDDAEGKFLLQYVERGILPQNPFQVLDREGVGKLIEMAVKLGRTTNPTLEVGICGEHGGDPSSIEFCHLAGLDYVSASPFRVPVARLAAAQAKLSAGQLELRFVDI